MTKCHCMAFSNHFDFQHDNRSIAVVSDKKSSTVYRYINENLSHLAKYRVDGGLIGDNGPKCDYILLNCEKQKSFFIEIKGSDLARAVEQIDRSIDLLKPSLRNFAIYARIVLTRVNTTDLRSIAFLKLEQKVNKLNGDLKKQTRILEETD